MHACLFTTLHTNADHVFSLGRVRDARPWGLGARGHERPALPAPLGVGVQL